MKKILTSVALVATLSQADFLGVEAGAALWYPSLDGNIKYQGSSIDYKNNLGFDDNDTASYLWVSLEHPVPIVPNLKIKHTKTSLSSSKSLSTAVTFANKTYNASTNTTTDIDIKQTDFIAYYEILDNWVNLDIGLNIKLLDGNVSLNNSTNSHTKDFTAPIPMLYAKAQFDLPFTGVSMSAEGSTISYDNNSLYDMEAAIGYESSFGLGAKAGYRVEALNIDDIEDLETDTKLSGAFFSIYYHF
jgi:outer membrane protein